MWQCFESLDCSTYPPKQYDLNKRKISYFGRFFQLQTKLKTSCTLYFHRLSNILFSHQTKIISSDISAKISYHVIFPPKLLKIYFSSGLFPLFSCDINDQSFIFKSFNDVFPRPPIETLFKDRYFVSGSGIAKWFKDPALMITPPKILKAYH